MSVPAVVQPSCLDGGGDAGALLRAIDWSATPLGPVEGWPLALQTAARIVLSSQFPMMLHWGPELITIYNDAHAPSLAQKHPGHLGRPAQEWWPEMWDQLTPIFDQVLTGQSYHVEDAAGTPDRDGRPQQAFFTRCHSPLWNDDGKIAGILLVVTEKTRQVVAERDLVQANASLEKQVRDRTAELRLYRNIVQSDTSPIVAFDKNHRLIGFNQAHDDSFLRVMGRPPQIGENLLNLYPPEQAVVLRSLMDRALAGEAFSVVEGAGDLDRGKPTWEIAYTPLRDEQGAVIGAFHHARDISARLRAERDLMAVSTQLAEQNAARERTWQYTPELLSIIDLPGGTFDRVNPAWLRVLGWSRDEMEGRRYAEFVHPDDIAASDAAFEDARSGNPVLRFENRYRAKDGSWRWMSWLAFPEGEKLYSSVRDVTDEKERGQALAEAEAALRQSQKMEVVGQLTGGLAHDFNNLLTGITGSLELLQTRMQQGRLADVDRYVTTAQGAAKRAAALTHRLLAFSRRQTLDPKPTDVNRMAAGMQDLIQRTVGPTVPIEVVGAPGLWPALVDPSQLENALLNLCINSRDAMPGGGRITIESANRWLDAQAARKYDMPEGQYLSLCVTDTGVGMPPEVVARVFEPFFTTKPVGEGTGLGLSMVYGFARQSGGQVRVYSEVGQGTTVCIYLPRHQGAVIEEAGVPAAPVLPRSEQGETVLVVDDEPTIRMLVTDMLEDLGYTSIEAADSAAGLKILQSNVRINLLVTDVGLPGGMNGRQMVDAARVIRPNLKVLFITGYAENAVLSSGRLKPGMAIQTKPFAIEAMKTRIRSMVESGQEHGARP